MTNCLQKFRLKLASLLSIMIAMWIMIPLASAQTNQCDAESGQQPSLTNAVALGVQNALNLSQEAPPNLDGAIAELNKLISSRGDRLQGYDKATVYEVLGSFKAQKDDTRGALRAFQTAVNTGALTTERANNLQYYIAQLQFQLENYDAAITGLRKWLRESCGEPPANANYLLALAYVQKEDYRNAQQPMEVALRKKNSEGGSPDKNYYSAMNLIYSENREFNKRAYLLERMINIWPEESGYWAQLA